MLSRLIKGITGAGQSAAAGRGRIFVCLMGGLGNQLFQYAFARFLASQGVTVNALVTNLFDGDRYARRPLLQAWSRLPAVTLSKTELAGLKIIADDNGMAVRDALLQSAQADSVCRGYWQQADFADAVADELAADLQKHGARFQPAAQPAECVVHVRRSDYGHHGLLPLAYYQAALESCGQPPFSVITDEPNYCEYVFSKLPGYTGVVRGNEAEPWADFYWMASAKQQIIANSSFSWWAAWLGRATGASAAVIAPAEWSLLKAMDPCPRDWRRIDVRLARP